MDRPSRARLLILAAVLLCAAAVGMIARPPDTPPAIKQTEGWLRWWWTSGRVEDPLYRTPQPLGHAGRERWELGADSRIEVLFRLDLTRDIFAPFAAQATGYLELDSHDLDGVAGTFAIDLAHLSSHDDFFEEGADNVFATLDESARRMEVTVESAHLGTAPRSAGATAQGDLVLRLPGGRDRERADVVVTRLDDHRIQVRSLDPIECSLPWGLDRLAGLAEGWGVSIVPREIAIKLRLELIRGGS